MMLVGLLAQGESYEGSDAAPVPARNTSYQFRSKRRVYRQRRVYQRPVVQRRRRIVPAMSYASASKLETESKSEESQTNLTASYTILPTWGLEDSSFRIENWTSLGVNVNDNFYVGYHQDFNFQGSDRSTDMAPVMKDGHVRFSFNNVWKSSQHDLKLDDRLWVILPTNAAKRDAGMVTEIRNWIIFTNKVTDRFSFSFTDIPILHLYSQPGTTDSSGDATANPIFENRVMLTFNTVLGGGLSLSIPFELYATRHQDYMAGATNNDAWALSFSINPNLTLSLSDTVSLSAFFWSGNLTQQVDYGLTSRDGFSTGTFQLGLGVTL